jgi:hypothetical protein
MADSNDPNHVPIVPDELAARRFRSPNDFRSNIGSGTSAELPRSKT